MFTKIRNAVKKGPLVAFMILSIAVISFFYMYLVEVTSSAFNTTPQTEVAVSKTEALAEITEEDHDYSIYFWIIFIFLTGWIIWKKRATVKQKVGEEAKATEGGSVKNAKDYLKSFFDFLKELLPAQQTTDFLIPVLLLGVLTWVEAPFVYDWFFTQEKSLQLVLVSVLVLLIFFNKPEWFKNALWFVFIAFFVITINNRISGGGITLEKITPDWIQNWGEEPEKEATAVKKSATSKVVLIAEPGKTQTFSVPKGHAYRISCSTRDSGAIFEVVNADSDGRKSSTLHSCKPGWTISSPNIHGIVVKATSGDQFTWSITVEHAQHGTNWD